MKQFLEKIAERIGLTTGQMGMLLFVIALMTLALIGKSNPSQSDVETEVCSGVMKNLCGYDGCHDYCFPWPLDTGQYE